MTTKAENSDLAQPESIKIELLVNMIPKFDGNKSHFYDFLDNCDLAESLATPNIKSTLLTFIKSKIIGNARSQIRNREFESWGDLRLHLVETYSDKRSHAQWQLELSLCKQEHRETVSAYAHRLENCLVRLTNSLDPNLSIAERNANVKLLRNQALAIFLLGLNKDLNIVVKAQRPQTLEDAISLAQAEEKEQIARREMDRHSNQSFVKSNSHFSRPNNFNQKSNFQFRQGHRTFSSHSITNQPKYNPTYNPTYPNSQSSHQNTKQCRYCKNLGHTIEECRKRQYNNSLRQQNQVTTQNPSTLKPQGFQHVKPNTSKQQHQKSFSKNE